VTKPDNYNHEIHITVRFADLDAMGHLNHAKYLTFMEQARVLYIQHVCELADGWENFGIILANITCDYHQPVAFAEIVTIYTRCSRLGGKSFDLEYMLVNEKAETVATGKTTLVSFDYQTNQTVTIPDAWRKKITTYEQGIIS
jgi:acyl-CoA thioester hydrolase